MENYGIFCPGKGDGRRRRGTAWVEWGDGNPPWGSSLGTLEGTVGMGQSFYSPGHCIPRQCSEEIPIPILTFSDCAWSALGWRKVSLWWNEMVLRTLPRQTILGFRGNRRFPPCFPLGSLSLWQSTRIPHSLVSSAVLSAAGAPAPRECCQGCLSEHPQGLDVPKPLVEATAGGD